MTVSQFANMRSGMSCQHSEPERSPPLFRLSMTRAATARKTTGDASSETLRW
jgi:hypothetical protein